MTMEIKKLILAIDGCSSTGKSSFARLAAKELGLLYLDSGALYRGVTLFAQEEQFISKMNVINPELQKALEGLELHFASDGTLHMGSRNIEKQIRTLEVSAQVSPISALAYVRTWVDEKLHEFGRQGGIVMDGRDIGTTVFPNADVKIFMTASEEVRARRRFDEMTAKGETPSMEDVVKNLRERDYMDSHREVSPLRKAEDAVVLDNSDMTMGEEIAWLKGYIQGKYAFRG